MEVQYRNKLGYYPLHTVCKYRSIDEAIVLLLIELFPKAARCKTLDGQYPLHLAMRHDMSEDVIMKLIEIFPEAVIESSTTTTSNETTLLWLALFHRISSQQVISKLIEINPLALLVKNDKDEYPIHIAIMQQKPIGIIKLFLDGDPLGMQRRCGVSFGDGSTPFHIACVMNDTNLVQYFMQRSDLQINARDSVGKTPLHHACNHRRETMVEMILRHPDVDVNAIDWCHGDTPLHITLRTEIRINSGYCMISYCHPEIYVNIIEKLLNHRFILINVKNKNDNKIPLDIIQTRINELIHRINNLTSTDEVQLRCYMKMKHSLKEFHVRQRWKSYCYHLNIFKDL